jgi:hypothetical protein
MKRLAFIPGIILVVLPLFMTSCEKDKPLSETIIGKWQVESVMQVNYENNVKKSAVTIFMVSDEMAVQFVAGGTGIMYQSGEIYGTFSWTLNGNTIVLSGGDTEINWDITVDNDTLVWTYSETETVETVIHRYEYFYSAKRVS